MCVQRAIYLEAAIATRVMKHVRSILSLAPQHSEAELLARPALFVSLLAQADSWRRLIDAQHYFEFLDFKDKKFVLDFLWVCAGRRREPASAALRLPCCALAQRSHTAARLALAAHLPPRTLAGGKHLASRGHSRKMMMPHPRACCCARNR